MTAHRGLQQSVMNRIARQAHALGIESNVLLTRFVTERFLVRLSRSRYADQFVLKGAALMPLWLGDSARPTRDADFAGYGTITPDSLKVIFRDVFGVTVEMDGLDFDAASITIAEIREGDEYGGYRMNALAHIGPSRVSLQVDVGLGDAVSPPPEMVMLPPVLDFAAPRLRAYHPETSIAEKFHVIATLGTANSRMKDYYDIDRLAAHLTFDGPTLRKAIEQTFQHRGEPLPSEVPDGLTDAFAASSAKQQQWRAFAKRMNASESLGDVVIRLRAFLMPVITSRVERWESGGPWS